MDQLVKRIILRLSERDYATLQINAQDKKQTISVYVRNLINDANK